MPIVGHGSHRWREYSVDQIQSPVFAAPRSENTLLAASCNVEEGWCSNMAFQEPLRQAKFTIFAQWPVSGSCLENSSNPSRGINRRPRPRCKRNQVKSKSVHTFFLCRIDRAKQRLNIDHDIIMPSSISAQSYLFFLVLWSWSDDLCRRSWMI